MSSMKASMASERSLYGLIVTATLLLTLENHENSAWDMAITILLTLLSILLAERYAAAFARGLENTNKSGTPEFFELAKDYLLMLYGSVIPVLIFIISGLGYLQILIAFNVAELFVSVLLVLYGYMYGQRNGRSTAISLLYGMANFSIVLAIVLFKSLFHI